MVDSIVACLFFVGYAITHLLGASKFSAKYEIAWIIFVIWILVLSGIVFVEKAFQYHH